VTTDPTPETPRQREILRRLRLVGGAPASYFRDACRLMAKEPELESQTHLVSHLLRELNSGLLGALKPMVSPEDWPKKGTEDAQAKMIGAACDAMRVPADDQLRRSWKAFSRKLAELAHRRGLVAPRPVNRDFEEHWELGEAVLHAVTQRIEANYAENLPRIEQLASGEPDIEAYRDTMLHSTVALDRFYSLAGVEWLEPLRKDGAFDHPPPLVANEEGMYVYPRWPQGRFLTRVATAAPREVIEIGQALETSNPEAQESLVAAACSMEVSDAVALVERIEEWLRNPIQWSLPFKARDLVVRFVDGNAVEEGLALMRALVTSPENEGGTGVDGEQVTWLTERVFPTLGIAGLDLLADLLTEQAKAESGRGLDYSQIWRPDISSERMRDDRDHLVSAVRDAASSLVEAGADHADVVAALERPALQITRRIAIDLLSRHARTDAARSYLLDREILEDSSYRREYTMLAEASFADLDGASQDHLLEWIGEAQQLSDQPERQRLWQLQMLTAFGDQLSEEWTAKRAELESEFGPIEPGHFVLPQARFVGSHSPIAPEEMKAMETDALLNYLRTWEPEDDFEAPSMEGLARVLEGVIKEEPDAYATAALGFADVDPTYVRALLSGLDGALESKRDFDWHPVLDLIAAIGDRPRNDEGQDQAPSDGDPGWSWSWQQALTLIIHGLNSPENQIGGDLFDAATEIVRSHVERPDPTITAEGEDGREPESVALNSVRCTALRATIILAARKREADTSGEAGLDSEVATLLKAYLDPDKEPSRAVRSIFGWYFPTLMFSDEAWALAHVAVIFPTEGQTRLWRAAWESFVMRNHGHPKLLEALGPSYRRAVEEISPEKPEERLNDPDEALVAHLVSYYLSGSIDFGDDSLLDRFYVRASTERRAQAISILGTSMEALSPLKEEGEARLRALAERRLEAVEGGAEADELAGFARWFSSGEFDTDWSLDFMRRALQAGCHPHPDHVVAERLAELSGGHAVERIEILRLMVEGGARDWFVLGSRERIEAILREGLASGGEATSRARDLINVIVARGNLDFADLLGGEEGKALG
jgi:hypothetical protein